LPVEENATDVIATRREKKKEFGESENKHRRKREGLKTYV
jgi:hypothetical protein